MFEKRSHQLLRSLCEAFSSKFSSVSELTYGRTFSSVAPVLDVAGVTMVVKRSSSELSLFRLSSSSELQLELGSEPESELSRQRDFLGGVFFRSGFLDSCFFGSCFTSSFPDDLAGVRDDVVRDACGLVGLGCGASALASVFTA
jgi:hypothetical protein